MREKFQVLSEFWLKIFAFLFMTMDHVGIFMLIYYPSDGTTGHLVGDLLRMAGRIAFPLFALMLAEGMRHTHDRKAYLYRLAVMWALMTAIDAFAFYAFGNVYGSEPFADLLACAAFIYFVELKGNKKWLCLLPLAYVLFSYAAGVSENLGFTGFSASFPAYIRCAYSLFGFALFLGFYYSYKIADKVMKGVFSQDEKSLALYRQTREYRSLINMIDITVLVTVTFVAWGLSYLGDARALDTIGIGMSFETYCLLAFIFIGLYNGKRGYNPKWFEYGSYLFFPVHIVVIWLIFTLI